jgi:type VI secretion system protein ImpM
MNDTHAASHPGLRVMEVGLYGKLPSHGDFLRRRTSDTFVDRWDAWLQRCMAASQSVLGERWLDVYLSSPAWRAVADHRRSSA